MLLTRSRPFHRIWKHNWSDITWLLKIYTIKLVQAWRIALTAVADGEDVAGGRLIVRAAMA